MKIEDCKDDILLGIKERMAQIEAKTSTEIKGATQLENAQIRYSRKRSSQKQPLQKPPSRRPHSPPVFKWKAKAKSFATFLRSKNFLPTHGE